MPGGWAATQLVIPTAREQEYLLHVIEAALEIRTPAAFFLWAQGQLQTLLPHQLMVCLQFDGDDELLRAECLHGQPLAAATLRQLTDERDGLVVRLLRHGRVAGQFPSMFESARACATAPVDAAWSALQAQMELTGFQNALMHGTERLAGGASFFVLFGLPHRPGMRDAYFLRLLLPYLHLALAGLGAGDRANVQHGPARRSDTAGATAGEYGAGPQDTPVPARPLSERERQVMHWLREGKSNEEMAVILGISGLTVKNHLQRLYRLLSVSNRTHAVSRCISLRLLERDPAPSRARRTANSARVAPR